MTKKRNIAVLDPELHQLAEFASEIAKPVIDIALAFARLPKGHPALTDSFGAESEDEETPLHLAVKEWLLVNAGGDKRIREFILAGGLISTT